MEIESLTKRRRRLVRASSDDLPPHRLSPKDRQIVQAVYEHRVLTADQIRRLLFPTKAGQTHCQHRLKLLFHHGYLFRDEIPVKLSEARRPLVYFLDTKGAEWFCQAFDLEPDKLSWHPRDNTVSHPFLEHLLETNDIRIAVELAAEAEGFVVQEWLDDKTLKSLQMKDYVMVAGPRGGKFRVAVVPDGYFHLRTPDYHFRFFLEVDRGTVTGQWDRHGRRSWDRKIRAFLAYYETGMYQERYGSSTGRVLTVTSSQKRLANLKAVTEEAGGRDRFWFTVFDEVTPETVLTAPIWQRATSTGRFALVG